MEMTLRWYGSKFDTVTLEQIRQIPGVSGVATHLTRIPVGDVWTMDEINLVKDEINSYGLEMEVIESLNIHEDIKKGLPSRDMLIDNYIESMRNLAKAGVKCICYNFMPVMDWYRSDLAMALSDGSTAMAYSHDIATKLTLESITSSMIDGSNNFSLPGWEPERFGQMAEDIKRNNGFIPGVKPGKATADYLDTIMSRITWPGALFLAIVAILPSFASMFGVKAEFGQFFGGTSLLILVGVVLDTLQQIESHLLMRHYDGLMSNGRIKGRSGAAY